MTTLYLIPDKAGKAFIAHPDVDVTLMDTAIVDLAALVRYAEDTLAIHCEEEAFNIRLCRYYKLLRRFLCDHPDSALRNSFELAHLSTARQMLIWRDELKMAQWDFCYDDASTRLGALAGIERMAVVYGLPDRILALVGKLEADKKLSFADLRIVLNTDRHTLRPLLRRLLDALELCGAEIATA